VNDTTVPVNDTTPVNETTVPVNETSHDTSIALALDVDIDKLSICEVNEPVAETAATDAALECRLLALFSQLHHLNLAHNKVCCSDECPSLLFLQGCFHLRCGYYVCCDQSSAF